METRLRHLLASGRVETRVVAPIPWFPLAGARFGRYAHFTTAPASEERFGIAITHPRYPVIPKIGMTLAPVLLFAAAKWHVRRILNAGFDFDLIDAHYFYPDGVAAVLLARALNKPVVITARGTDINLIPAFALPRRMVLWAAANADSVITVSQALKSKLASLGATNRPVHVLRNGVDLEFFTCRNQAHARAALKVEPPVLVVVGNLVKEKRHDLILESLADVAGATLLIVGKGPEEARLRQRSRSLHIEHRVHFLGFKPQAGLPLIYSAANALLLMSDREGWPNVLLESMACGTPVVARNVGGVAEVVAAPEAGRLVDEATPQALSTAIRALLADPPDRAATRAYAERFSWDDTTEGQLELFRDVIEKHRKSHGTERYERYDR